MAMSEQKTFSTAVAPFVGMLVILGTLGCESPRVFHPKDGGADLLRSDLIDVAMDREATGGSTNNTGGQIDPPGSGGIGGVNGATGSGGSIGVDAGSGGTPNDAAVGTGGRIGASGGSGGLGGGPLASGGGPGTGGGGASSGGRSGASGGTNSGGLPATGGRGTGGASSGGSGTGGRSTGGVSTGGMGTGGASSGGTCGSGLTSCSGSCVNLQTDATHCGSCTAAPCGGTCQSGLCCTGGKTNCGGTCVDLTSDDLHCGACSGGDSNCTQSGQALKHCRASMCRLADGQLCSADGDCLSGKCDMFYADGDHDGYPDRFATGRYCTFGGTVPVSGGGSIPYIPSRADMKWDCCDQHPGAYPGATAFSSWHLGAVLTSACQSAFGDTNCDGKVEVDPGATVTTGCDTPDGVSCNVASHPATTSECGVSLCGCGAPGAGGFCSLYCPPGDPGVGCR